MASASIVGACFIITVFSPCLAQSVFDNILGDTDSCENVCGSSFPLHTYDKPFHLSCCARGCRLFSIIDFVHENLDFNVTREACHNSCSEAYSKTPDRDACSVGCNSQLPFAKQRRKQEENEAPNIHVLFPFMSVRGIYSNMFDKFYKRMSVSWSFFMQADNNKLVIVKSAPKIYTYGEYGEDEDYKTMNYFESNLEPLDNSATPNLKHSQVKSLYPNVETVSSSGYYDSDQPDDWLGCISKKTGLPRLFLSLTIFLSAMVMVWLCLTTAATAQDHKVKQEKLSIQGDLDYLKTFGEKGQLLHIHPQDTVQADPLPIKIRVERV